MKTKQNAVVEVDDGRQILEIWCFIITRNVNTNLYFCIFFILFGSFGIALFLFWIVSFSYTYKHKTSNRKKKKKLQTNILNTDSLMSLSIIIIR